MHPHNVRGPDSTSGLRTPDIVRIQRPLLAPKEEDIGGPKNPDASHKKPSNTIKPTTSDGSALWLDYKLHFEACLDGLGKGSLLSSLYEGKCTENVKQSCW